MITNFSVTNFKSFAAEAEVTLGELLVISGPNSCGKTTLIQALLLLSQSLDSSDPGVALDLGGRYIQFAAFRDAVFGRPVNSKAQFSVCFESNSSSFDCVGALKRQPALRPSELQILSSRRNSHPNVDAGKIDVSNKYKARITFGATTAGIPFVKQMSFSRQIGDKFQISHELDRKGKTYAGVIRSQPIGRWANSFDFGDAESNIRDKISKIGNEIDSLNRSTLKQSRIKSQSIGEFCKTVLSHYGVQDSLFLESVFTNKRSISILDDSKYPPELYTLITTLAQSLLEYGRAQKITTPINIKSSEFFIDHFLPGAVRYPPFFPWELDPKTYRSKAEPFSAYRQCVRDIKNYVHKIHYLGPLRAKPERAYLPTGTPSDMGNAGEYAVPILWLNGAKEVDFKCRPGNAGVTARLDRAVVEWFAEFGIAHSLHVTKPKRVIYQAELDGPAGSNIKVTIADVGFGVSQLLPVILKGLLAPIGATLIFEQPEIHLHPKLQAKLADFFICLVELRKRVIVETHSEHLINMLRLRTVEDHSGQLQKHIRISFVQANPKTHNSDTKGSFISNLELDQYGQITNWPPDFFPEHGDLTERILMAMLAKPAST